MKLRNIYILICILTASAVNGQEVLTIDKARNMALEYNRTLKVADLREKEVISNQKEARTAYLPMIDGTGTLTYLPDMDDIEIPGMFMPTADANGNITGESDVYFPGMALETAGLRLYQAQVAAAVPIYAGGQIRYGNKMADKGVEIAHQDYQLKTDEVILNTDNVYWQLVALKENLIVADKYVEMLDSLQSQLQTMYDVGLTPRSEYLKVKVQKNEAELNLIKARNGYKILQMNLCQLVGLPLSTQIELSESLHDNPEMINVGDALNLALDNRNELKMLDGQVEIAELQKKSTAAEYLPQLGAQVSYGYMDIPTFETSRYMTQVNAQLSIPIVHWRERKHKMDAARYKKQQAQLQLDDTKELVQLEVQQYMLNLMEAYETIVLAKSAKEEAEESLEEVKISYEAGLNSTTDLLDAQASWQSAHAQLLTALADYEIAKTSYYKGIGQLNQMLN
ncbi:TolC family protein [Carboxylicivirga linearis]|uniref:TolC family protein n=1 Tax=Carboxylicivirga linearis TaxID=1628157 RepID=A0ABS5JY80_9BACT|nr:TolC family protein [Carboxylicivirga linearis]MBS2099862.1 TolC family protein [Carboxylicivirga linearis]